MSSNVLLFAFFSIVCKSAVDHCGCILKASLEMFVYVIVKTKCRIVKAVKVRNIARLSLFQTQNMDVWQIISMKMYKQKYVSCLSR